MDVKLGDRNEEQLTIKVDFPGYFLDGEVLEGHRQTLITRSGIEIPCFMVKDPDTGEYFGIPTNKAYVLRDPPVIDLRGRLHAHAGMFAEVV